MQKFPLPLTGTSPDGDSYMIVVPFATHDGVPQVVLMVRLDSPVAYEATLDGHPAVALFMSEKPAGESNAPWELGHLMAESWEEAKKLAAAKNTPAAAKKKPAAAKKKKPAAAKKKKS